MRALSVKSQILVLVATGVLFALVLLGLLTSYQIRARLREGLEQKALSISNILAANVGPGIEFQDTLFVGEIVSAVFCEDDVLSVSITDADGRLMFSKHRLETQSDTLAEKSAQDTVSLQHEGDLCIVSRPILARDQTVGAITLRISQASVEGRIESSIMLILTVAGAILLGVVALAQIMSRRIVKPIGALETAVSRIIEGDMTSPVDTSVFHRDFIALGEAFNHMQWALNDAFAKLHQSREQLSQRGYELEAELKERQLAEAALRSSEARYRTLFEAANDAIFIMNEEHVIDCNLTATKMYGCSREDMIERCHEVFFPKADCDPDYSCEDFMARVIDAMNGNPQSFEWQYDKADGSKIYAEVNINRIHLGDKRVVLTIIRDASERKRAEHHERELRDKLERAERMEALGALAGGVAHDLNNMLGPMVGYPELIMMKLPEDSPVRKQVEKIGKAATEAANVIQDLLTLARRGRYEMVPMNLNEVITEYVESPAFCKLANDRSDVRLDLQLEPSGTRIMGSAAHLYKVIMNLIVNAYDAMAGGGTLAIQTRCEHLTQLYSGFDRIDPGNYILVSVRDQGIGINPEDLRKIFEPYFSKKKMGRSGSGLGLSVVYGILKDHGGYYDVFSEPGKGTEFVLYFPVTQVAVKEKPTDVVLSGNGEKILVVDDSEEQREMASAILSSLNYQVTAVSNGHEAVDYLKNNQVDLVVLDMIMEKGFDGLDTFREIVKMRPGQRAIIVSGFSATDRVSEMQKLGAGAYIRKPYSRETIGKAVYAELHQTGIAVS